MARTMRSLVLIGLVATFALVMVGCMTHEHVVGTGAATGYTESAKQWYVGWGLVPLNSVDTKAMSGGAENYKIVTKTSVVDAIINSVASSVSIQVRTVQVVK